MIDSKNARAALARFVADNSQDTSFPDENIDYYDRFTRVDDYLNTTIHPNVNVGPTAREPIWLTDHGPEHISTVIRRAGDLTFRDKCILTPYEAYILLMSCHFHDVGNIFGREEHEKKIHDVMFNLDETLVGADTLEKRVICDIAMSHGGYVTIATGDKDTIGRLRYDTSSKSNHIGVKKLAALLRFSDELADDKTRTNRFVQTASNDIYPESEIFHAYAERLRPVEVAHESRSVEMHFELSVSDATRTYRKFKNHVLLFEEIFQRTLKMHREHVYCTRFMIPDVTLDRINVQLDVCCEGYKRVLAELRYSMAQHGYPDGPATIAEVCPTLTGITSAILVDRVNQLSQGQPKGPYDSPIDLLTRSNVTPPANSSAPASKLHPQEQRSIASGFKSLFANVFGRR